MEYLGDLTTMTGCSISGKLDGKGPTLSELDWFDVFIDVSNGLRAMHEKGCLNNDLHDGNVLLIVEDGRWKGKLIDFGMASMQPVKLNGGEDEKRLYQDEGLYRHYAPECALDDAPTSEQSDIFQVGSLMELVGQELGIDALITIGEFIRMAEPGKRPALESILDELHLQRSGVAEDYYFY